MLAIFMFMMAAVWSAIDLEVVDAEKCWLSNHPITDHDFT
jgi:hypothetical protein